VSKPPTFPTYRGPPLPQALNPLDPRHYGLLLKWIYFQPSRLKHYLYYADPESYRTQNLKALGQTLYLPAYRNLYLTYVFLIVLLSGGLAWVAGAVQSTPMDWWAMVFNVAFGVVFGLAIVVVGGLAFGVAFGAMFGVAFGIAGCMAGGMAFIVVVGIVGGLADGIAIGMAFGVAVSVGFIAAFGAVFGVMGAVAFIAALAVALGVAFGVTFVLAGSAALVVALFVTFVAAFIIGGSRLLVYPFEWLLAWFYSRSRHDPALLLARHPALWDEMALCPLPGTDRLLHACLAADLDQGLRLVTQVAANPFQRWAAQRALSDAMAERPDALAVMYRLAHLPALDEYLVPPCRRLQFQNYSSVRLVLLGEMGQRFVAVSSETTDNFEYLIWRFTRRWRQMKPTPLSQFSAVLYELFHSEADLETTDVHKIKLAEQFESAYEGVRQSKLGGEIAGSFATIATFLDASTIEALATAHQRLGWVDTLAAPPLRPAVVEALKALGDVSREVSTFVRATNIGQKSAALNRATGALNELAGYVQKEVLPPERVLLDRVLELWQSIIAAEQGRLGETALHEMAPAAHRAAGITERTSTAWQRPAMPLDNPYIVGNPVYPPLLVGRKDVFDRIGEVWSAKQNPDSIILYGHRRMGKSSILRNLDQVAPHGSVVVYADMAGETSFIASTANLLLGLADRIHTATQRAYPDAGLAEPDPETYATQARAQFQLNRLLEGVHNILAGRTLILALDEFEAVEKAVEGEKIGREIYQFLRAKTQEPWLALVFGGLHTLDEMSRDYQQPFYGSYENIRVSYLACKDAWRLIANPTDDFALNYEPEAIERIVAETGGQPYLVQQICRDALDHLNHELFDLGLTREVCIRLADVDAILNDDFFRRGTVYFDGVWTQTGDPDQQTLLQVMAQRDKPWAFAELEASAGLDTDNLHRQLRWAERHDVLRKTGTDSWEFCVPLMRRWIRKEER
jgi:AAA+ ATPase superfamily predicted ATPase